MPISEKTCENYAMLARCSAGFSYASFQNHIIGADPIVLEAAGRDGGDLEFAAPWEFLEENHLPGRIGLTQDDGKEVYMHVSKCCSDICKEAYGSLTNVSKVAFRKKDDYNPIDGVIIAAQFNPKNGSEPLVLVRGNGFGDAIDALSPIFRLYIDGREDFVWPGEGRVRLKSYCEVSFGPDSEGIVFKRYRAEEGSVAVPFHSIRKVRVGGRDIWRNKELYHVEISHPNEKSFNKGGTVELELREDRADAEKLASSIVASMKDMKRVN